MFYQLEILWSLISPTSVKDRLIVSHSDIEAVVEAILNKIGMY